MAKAEGDEAQAQEMEKMSVGCAVEAAKVAGEESCYKAVQEELEQFIIDNVDKVRLAAKSKMDSNISDLLPTQGKGSMTHTDDPLVGKLQFNENSSNAVLSDSTSTAVQGYMETA